MDLLWSPWRYDYITGGNAAKTSSCVFCGILNSSATDEEKYILHRAEFNFVILNIYPYATGHVMVIPYEHISNLRLAQKAATDEMMDLVKRVETVLFDEYAPDGFNMGLNLGKAGGAGVAEHYHMHVLPRWIGDVNFMTSIGQTRTMPETLQTTFERLRSKL